MIDPTVVFASKESAAVPVPVPTNEAIYQLAGDTGKRTLWSAEPGLSGSCLSSADIS